MIPGAKPSSENDSDDAESESSLEAKEQGNGDEEEDIEDTRIYRARGIQVYNKDYVV